MAGAVLLLEEALAVRVLLKLPGVHTVEQCCGRTQGSGQSPECLVRYANGE
jgi:hypothetical protein